jgi:hypothetical protein
MLQVSEKRNLVSGVGQMGGHLEKAKLES